MSTSRRAFLQMSAATTALAAVPGHGEAQPPAPPGAAAAGPGPAPAPAPITDDERAPESRRRGG